MPKMPPGHRRRDDPYPDEAGQLYCSTDDSLCSPGRPCACCWSSELPGGGEGEEAPKGVLGGQLSLFPQHRPPEHAETPRHHA
jgi:hypothetical protein